MTDIKESLTNKRFAHSSWGKVVNGVPQGSIFGPLLFLPNILKGKSIPILFADDTSIIVKNPNCIEYENELTLLLKTIIEWFKTNLLTLNLDKTCFVQFSTKNSNYSHKVSHTPICILNSTHLLGSTIPDTNHIRTARISKR
jgi:hypothetical protein